MKSVRKTGIKHIVDAAMTGSLLCLMAYPVTGETLHEWFGIAMTALLIAHHMLNRRWYAALFKGKYSAFRAVTLAVNTLLLVSIALTAVCGMAMSAHAVPFLYGILPVSFARQTHLSLSHWSFVLTGLHLGLHLPALARALRQKRGIRAAAAAVWAVAACCGVWVFFKNSIPGYLLFQTPFAFFDSSKSAFLVFGENLAMLLAWAGCGFLVAAGLQKRREKTAAAR